MTCCHVIDPLVNALRNLIAYTDKQYLSKALRETTIEALVAMANAEARVCTVCGKNLAGHGQQNGTTTAHDGNLAGTVIYGYIPPDPDEDTP